MTETLPIDRGPAGAPTTQRTDRSLRERAARGTLVNTAFEIGLYTLTFGRGLIIAAFLTRASSRVA